VELLCVIGAWTFGSCAHPTPVSPLRESGAAVPSGAHLSVASLNSAMEKDSRTILRDLGKAPIVRDADLLLLQEVVHSEADRHGVAGEVARALNRHVVFAPEGPGVYNRGLAILSRYPIRDTRVHTLRAFNLRFHKRLRFALAATIDTPSGPVRVCNVHLDTRINSDDRIEQLRPVLEEVESFTGPRLIGGDFNTNAFYWLWNVIPVPGIQRQAEAVRRFMSAHGFTAPLQSGLATFNHLGMHLDWIFEKGLEPHGVTVAKMPFSDHRALVMQFAFRRPLPAHVERMRSLSTGLRPSIE
jgi:endonuclease/exonuclease/phosphatase family metal-dependent hydrolase